MQHLVAVRQAEAGDVPALHALLAAYAEEKIILPRTQDNIFQHLQEFVVAEYDGALVGVAALHVYGSNLAEVRSLVVDAAHQGVGIGRLLVEACEKLALGLGVAKLFALTYVTEFFARMGYEVVPKESLPQKVWTVCVHCERFTDCNEVAVQKKLSDAPIMPMRISPIIEEVIEGK